jgi:hypothetical protein
MRFCLGALLCLSGIAACSHNSEAVKDPSYDQQSTVASADPPMQPASLENTDTTPSSSRTDADMRAPLVADTKGTKNSDFPAKGSPAADPPKASTNPPAAPEPA